MSISLTKVRNVVLNGNASMPNSVTRAYQDMVPFKANNSLTGEWTKPVSWAYHGRLNKDERDAFQSANINAAAIGELLYVVTSYSTPIVWAYRGENGRMITYRVSQKFSVTTTKHMGMCY